MARLLVDESLPPALAEALTSAGHDAQHAQSLGLGGADDDAIADAAIRMDAVLVTLDLDFADVRRFAGLPGAVVVRLRRASRERDLTGLVCALLERFAPEIEQLTGAIMILEPGRSRIRRRV